MYGANLGHRFFIPLTAIETYPIISKVSGVVRSECDCAGTELRNIGEESAVTTPVLEDVRRAARERILYLPHALDAMNAPSELITADEVRRVVFHGQVIEDYPGDVRGHSCLILGAGDRKRPIHVVCSPKDEYLAIITVYLPDERHWETDWKTRKVRG